MKKSLLFISLALLFSITSCSDDEPNISPLVGTWILDDITASDLPSGYVFASDPETSYTIWGEDTYTIDFYADGTYERELSNTISGDLEDTGEWTFEGNEIDLDQDETDTKDVVTKLTVQGEITERSMTVTGKDLWVAWPPEVVNDPNQPIDTLEGLTELNDFFNEYGAIVEVTVTMEFDKR